MKVKDIAVEKKVIKHGICYMCTYACPTKVHVSDGRATRIDLTEQNVADVCQRWKAQLDFVYHPDRGPGTRVSEVQVGGEPLDPERTYRVVTVDYLYTHPDFKSSLAKGSNVIYDGLHLDAVVEYVRAPSPIAPQVEGRIQRR